MIGINVDKKYEKIAEEFFQLFKTPWEFYNDNSQYDIVISSKYTKIKNTKNILVYHRIKNRKRGLNNNSNNYSIIKFENIEFPIYCGILTFNNYKNAFLFRKDNKDTVGVKWDEIEYAVVEIGYNIFEEMEFLLSNGQPKQTASYPTMDIHIQIMRMVLLRLGIPIIEIIPKPLNYDFIVCLTHDVDFVNIRHHKFDSTFFGFIYRLVLKTIWDVIIQKKHIIYLIKIWNTILSIPIVFLNIKKDFWNNFREYIAIENNFKSTFFFIPFSFTPGKPIDDKPNEKRASKYQLNDITSDIENLLENGKEIGLHGIDSWHDVKSAKKELNKIKEYIKQSNYGIRMHWLYYDNNTFRILDKSGFRYDSSVGYNDQIGFRSGTVQVYKPLNAKRLLELPLNIQDTALLSRKRMNLSEKSVMPLLEKLFLKFVEHGGVLVVNWHQRSIAPERWWGNIYAAILRSLLKNKVWIDTAINVVEWFKLRRGIQLNEHISNDKKRYLKIREVEYSTLFPNFAVRIFQPLDDSRYNFFNNRYEYRDFDIQNFYETKQYN